MALNDLIAETHKSSFHLDAATEERLVDSVLALVNDGNTEVKNHAVKASVRAHDNVAEALTASALSSRRSKSRVCSPSSTR